MVNGGSPDWAIDYDAIIDAHLERQPSRLWPGLRFAIPMSQEEWESISKRGLERAEELST